MTSPRSSPKERMPEELKETTLQQHYQILKTVTRPSILCIIDFSESSTQALIWAAGMAAHLSAHLIIVHPHRLNQLVKNEDRVLAKKKMDIEATKNFEQVAKNLFKNSSVSYDFQSEIGFIQDRVQEYIRKNNILLVAMGKKLMTANKETVDELMEQIDVPLVIIPHPLRLNF